jgi:hypothetical protein
MFVNSQRLVQPLYIRFQLTQNEEWRAFFIKSRSQTNEGVPTMLKEMLRYWRQGYLRNKHKSVIIYVAVSAIQNFTFIFWQGH